MAIAPAPVIDSPRRALPEFGYSDFIEWTNVSGPHWRNGITTEPWSCPLDVHEINDPGCINGIAQLQRDKALGPRGVGLVEADPFVLHADYNCGVVGRSLDEAKARAEHRLNISEDLGLSRRVIALLRATPAADLTVLNPTANTPVSLAGGIGILQQWMARNIGANGVIHAPIILGPYLAEGNQMRWDAMDRAHRDVQGNRWAFGASHGGLTNAGPLNSTPAGTQVAGEAWLYATSQWYGVRGETFLTPDDDELLNRSNNDVTVLAEREYVLWHECDVAAVKVSVSCCC